MYYLASNIDSHYQKAYSTRESNGINSGGEYFEIDVYNPHAHHLNIFVAGYDPNFENTYYFFREVFLRPNSKRKIKVRLPFIGNRLVIELYSYEQLPFRHSIKHDKLPKRKMILNNKAEEFLDFSISFCQKAGYIGLDTYKSKNKKFTLIYDDYCYSERYNIEKGKFEKKKLTTPAMVDGSDKTFYFAKDYIKYYSVLGRFALFCHEFSHVYLNPQLGFGKEYETGADINGLHIFMGLGIYPFEFLKGFLYVFDKSKPGAHYEFNRTRYLKMKEFVERFQSKYFDDDFVFVFKI